MTQQLIQDFLLGEGGGKGGDVDYDEILSILKAKETDNSWIIVSIATTVIIFNGLLAMLIYDIIFIVNVEI